MKYPFDEILAKSEPKKSLLEHTKECIEWIPKLLKWYDVYIKKFSQFYNIPIEKIIQRLFLTVALHDIGKSTDEFQDKIRGININSLVSHSLASVPFIYFLIKDNPILKFGNTSYYPEILSIASHHTKLKKDLFANYNNVKFSYLNDEYYNNFFDFINSEAKKQNIANWNIINFNSKMTNTNLYDVFEYYVLINLEDDEIKYEKTNIIRDFFVLFKSFLHYCDWLASSGEKEYIYSTREQNKSITEKMMNKNNSFKNWSSFQLECAKNSNTNIFVQIPTGQGKTEAAALWATNNNNNQKILFLLPTMVTANKMWERIKNFFGDDNLVGLSHSTAQYILNDQEIEPEILRKELLYNRTFFKSVTVATIDQLIYSFFNWGYWVLTNAAGNNAKIIIDEIHTYDAYTFGLILEIIDNLKHFNTQFAIMSASLPNILKNEIEKILPNNKLIYDEKLNLIQRHIIFISEGYIEDSFEDIINDFEMNHKVLIVCNTIKNARKIYDLLKEKIDQKNLLLYHSQFILLDKIEKEDILYKIHEFKTGFIAICTQIVEVSLDIDFDVLYTENAPIDAIIQRLGRVNRRGDIKKRIPNMEYAKVIITKESEDSSRYVYKDLSLILNETYSQIKLFSDQKNGNLNETDLKQIVENVYTKENLCQSFFESINEGRKLIKTLWNDYLYKIYTLNIDEAKLLDISSRKNDYITIESVLYKHYQELNFEELIENKNYDLLRKYTVKVPIYIAKKYMIKKLNDSDIYLLDLDYNKDEGISLKSSELNFI